VFDQKFGLSDPSVTIAKEIDGDGNPPRADNHWSTETALDVEWAHAIAPAAKILLCQATDSNFDNLTFMVDFARNFSGVSVVSMSFGGREFERSWNPSSWFDANQTDYDGHFTTPQGHRPVSFVASSGDVGSIVAYPSTSPNVLAVGGTVITAFQNVSNSLYALNADAEALAAETAAESSAAESLKLVQAQFKSGGASYLQVLTAEQSYQTSAIALVKARAQRYVDTAALFQSLGGGWWNRTDVAADSSDCCKGS